MSFTVSSYDVCSQGFERLRSYSEIILCAYVDSETDGAAVWQFYNDSFVFPVDLPAPSEDGESCIAFLYLKDERAGAHYPVY